MASKTTTQAQQEPVTEPTDRVDANLARMEAVFAEIEQVQKQNFEQMETAIDEGAKLMKASMAYSGKMMAEWQRMARVTSRQAVTAFTFPFAG